MAQKTYLFKELYIETIIRNPKKVGLFAYREGYLRVGAVRASSSGIQGFSRALGWVPGLKACSRSYGGFLKSIASVNFCRP